ncbi:hypothetical protein DY000_02007756 [Brassica cretica]|uniref:Secreted protein n=1 Tax=Brassica cretica TaxID=69181 RepID=A0ABQ7CD63_BRACR|nr:hypothetical protein DY000_02007756 [Brassica cretica]
MALSISRFAFSLLGGKGGNVLYTLSITGSAGVVIFGALGVDCRSTLSCICRSISSLSFDFPSWFSRSGRGSSNPLVRLDLPFSGEISKPGSSSFPLFTFIFSKALMVAMFSVSRIASSGSATFWRTLVILELFEVQNCTDASDIAMDETLPRSDVMPDLLKSGMSASRDEAIEETIEMSIDGAPLVSIDGAPLVSIDGAPLVSIDGAPLVSIDSAPLVSIDGDDRMWAEYISIPT